MKWLIAAAVLLFPQEDTLRVAWGTVRTVDPALAVTPQDMRVAEALFDGLGGATAVTDLPDITFTLPDRKWSDGRPVTASDYRFAWMRCLDPATGSPWAFRFRHIKNAREWHETRVLSTRILMYENESAAGRIDIANAVAAAGRKGHASALKAAAAGEKDQAVAERVAVAAAAAERRADLKEEDVGIKVLDAHTLRVTVAGHPPVELMATLPFRPVPEHVVRARREQWTHPDHIVTSGPFAVEKWTRAGLVLKGPVTLAFVNSDLPGEVWPLYERGSVDWIDRAYVPPEKIEALASSGELRSAPGDAVVFLRAGPGLKPGLRRAIALAVDRGPLLKKAGPGSEETRSFSGGGESPARDLAAAMTALAGDYPDLKIPRLRLLVWKGSATEETARGVRDQLEESLAFTLRFDLREGPAYQQALAAGDYDIAVASFAPEAGDRAGALELFAEGRDRGEKALLESGDAVPLLRLGEWFAAKPRVDARPGVPLSAVRLKR